MVLKKRLLTASSATMSARDALTKHELVAEACYRLMRERKLIKEEYCSRMEALDRAGPAGIVGSSYCSFMLLRAMPPSAEKEFHMAHLTAKLRHALEKL